MWSSHYSELHVYRPAEVHGRVPLTLIRKVIPFLGFGMKRVPGGSGPRAGQAATSMSIVQGQRRRIESDRP